MLIMIGIRGQCGSCGTYLNANCESWNVNFTRGLVMRVDTNNKKKAFIRVAGRTQVDTYCGRRLAAENRVTNRKRHTKGQISKPGRGPVGHIKRQTFSKAYNIYKTCLFRVDARVIICNSGAVSNLMLGGPRYSSLIQLKNSTWILSEEIK